MRVLLIGADRRYLPLLEALKCLPGIQLLGVCDETPNVDSRKIAHILGLPALSPAAVSKEVPPDLVLHLDDRPCPSALLAQNHTTLKGPTLRLLELLTAKAEQQPLAEESIPPQRERRTSCGTAIIGKSPQIRQALDLFEQVAPTPTSVLLLGETGTGKDLAASCIHLSSHLRKKPFVAVNCTAFTPSLMESELFGYVKGAFTGADRDRRGLLEEADHGTLFLDEIGDMPIELQAKLLRFLQTGEARRVGSTQVRNLSVRIIAATNRNLEQAMVQGLFRQDLFYRFNTFTVTMPPLRERAVDIPYLAYHFLTRAEEKLNKRVKGFSDDVLGVLCAYDWPGNVRELKNIIERAVILCKGANIELAHLPEQLVRVPTPIPAISAPNTSPSSSVLTKDRDRVIANFEKKELLQYLKKAAGNVSEASRLSGVPRRTFYRKMRKYGL
ncbi:sigma-54 interaction domain-containing protein [Desulfonatronum thioautotrophicum]|uniref:sigma-54 interaction domain-containing protein n=1 Tax=Desulfonatronum thioautotrophicum TaxID=617001 RepID=UPI0005EB352F|nr:sigma-54 dependent transcriptional regulator [Desulfonatronum thioautotrophicum]